MSIKTSTEPKRVIYFKGLGKDSLLITRLCKDYETISKLYDGECASRTLSNLYNLQTVRGNLYENTLQLETSMSGPHHYFGYILPSDTIVIDIQNSNPIYYSIKMSPRIINLLPLPDKYKYKIKKYNWIKGINLTENKKKEYNIQYSENEFINTQITSADSLFSYTGILELDENKIELNIIDNPQDYNLSSYKIKIVKNSSPFSFNQTEINKYKHTQHKLRIVTYNYEKDYFKKYILKKNGAFIEQHEFVQMITPLNENCTGYTISGRFIGNQLELIGFKIPFGYTLLVEPFALHGDSSLIGLYSMAMTGNHEAMSTADTVLIKNRLDKSNVIFNITKSNYNSSDLLITSNKLSTDKVKLMDKKIEENVYNSQGNLLKYVFQHKLYTGFPFIRFDKIYYTN